MNQKEKDTCGGFPGNIKKVRKKLGKSQEEMARVLSTTKTTIFRYEKGEAKPGLKVLSILNRDLNVNLNWLVSGGNDNKMFIAGPRHTCELSISDLFPDIPPEKDLIALIKGLEVPIVRYSLIAKFLEFQRDFEPFIKDHYQEKKSKKF